MVCDLYLIESVWHRIQWITLNNVRTVTPPNICFAGQMIKVDMQSDVLIQVFFFFFFFVLIQVYISACFLLLVRGLQVPIRNV